MVQFVLGCARKHIWLALTLFLLVSVPGVLVARVLPLQYAAHTRILVNSREGIRTRVMDDSNAGGEELGAVQDRLMRLENMRRIVDLMKLEQTWDKRLPPFLAFKDRVRGGGLNTLSKEDRIRALMGTVESRISVSSDSYMGIVSIEGRWTDPDTAFELTDTVKNLYLNDRLRAEIQVFEEVISILEQQKKDTGREIDLGLARVEQAGWKAGPAKAAVGDEPARSGRLVETIKEGGVADPEIVTKLESVRRQIRELQEPWQHRLSDLKLQLTDLSSNYGPKHPLVINQQNRIDTASVPPTGLNDLKAEENRLATMVEESSRPRERIVLRGMTKEPTATEAQGQPKDNRVKVESSATLSAEQTKLIQAVNKYNNLIERIDRTRIELNMASTAFKYRFNVVLQPEKPISPTKPKLRMFVAVGAIAFGLLLALLVGPLRELASGKFIAPWQAKTLGIPMLGELCLSDDDSQ